MARKAPLISFPERAWTMITTDTKTKLDALCIERGLRPAEFVRQLITEAVKDVTLPPAHGEGR